MKINTGRAANIFSPRWVSLVLNKIPKWSPRKAAAGSFGAEGKNGGDDDQNNVVQAGQNLVQEAMLLKEITSEKDCAADIENQIPLNTPSDYGNGTGGGDSKFGGQDGDGDHVGGGREDHVMWGKTVRFPREGVAKLAKVSMAVTAQTAVSLIVYPLNGLSKSAKVLLYLAVGTNISAYIFCLAALLLCSTKPLAAGITGLLGSAAAALGFLLMMGLIFPENLIWIPFLTCFLLLLLLTIVFIVT